MRANNMVDKKIILFNISILPTNDMILLFGLLIIR